MEVLIDSLEHAWRDRDDFYVGGNMFVYFSAEQVRHNDFRGPDVFVVLDTTRRERKSWVAWQEEGRLPDVVIELTSPSTEAIDRGIKKDLYARRMRVSVYVIFDPVSGVLEAYQLDRKTRRYGLLSPNGEGRIEVEPLDLFLGLHPTRVGTVDAPLLRWFDRNGRVLPTRQERAEEAQRHAEEERQRAEEAQRHAEEERQRAEEAQRRAEEERQRAEEAQRRAEEERQRAEEAQRRAEKERQRAEEAQRRAEDLALRLAEYERRFGSTPTG
jgi:Uma2 family endonuclease